MFEQGPQLSAQSFAAAKFQLQDELPQIPAVEAKAASNVEIGKIGTALTTKYMEGIGCTIRNDGSAATLTGGPFPGFNTSPAVAANAKAADASDFSTADRATCGKDDGQQAFSQFVNQGKAG
jgi:hypothetical protein